jgi:ProP effector
MTMNDLVKLSTSKDILAYLTEKFPTCFVQSGSAHPLKIGIFDDLASRLADDPMVSKTRLRSAVRHYTNSWRYLRCIKVGAQRLDLDGQPAGTVEASHAEHAQQQLAEAKALVLEKKPVNKRQKSSVNSAKPSPKARSKHRQVKIPSASNGQSSPLPVVQSPALTAAVSSSLKLGQQVMVKVANNTLSGQITEIDRNDLQVQLGNGVTVKVQFDAVYVVKQEC